MLTNSRTQSLAQPGFYRTALGIAVPVVVAHLIGISLNMIDTMMIGKLGLDELSGVGAANRVFFVFSIICFGFFSGVSVHIAQYWGKEDVSNIRRLLGIDYAFGLGVALVFMVLSYFCAPAILGLFADNPAIIDFGVGYLRIVQLSFPFTALSFVLSFNSRAIHRLLAPTVINGVALATNTFLNYCLIYGNFGFPMLGVEGAAIATVIARMLEFTCLALYVYLSGNHPLAATWRDLRLLGRGLRRRVFRTALPVTISEATWSIGNAVYYIAYGTISDAAIGVVQVATVVNDIFQALFFGLGNACAVMIGNELGRGRKDLADSYSRRFLWICFGFCLLTMVLFWFAREPILRFYDLEPAASLLLDRTLIVYIAFVIPRMLTYTLFIGILRAGGDARFCMVLDLGGIWCVGVPLAFLGAKALGWDLPAVVALSLAEEVVKLVLCLWRLRSKKWINTLV